MVTETKVIISGDAGGASRAVRSLRSDFDNLGRDLGKLQALAANALAFGGISLTGTAIIKLADQYGQLTARLQLATRYSGDFDEVQKALRDSANSTRSSLAETVDLYTKISPAILAMGKTGQQSIGIISTVNKAIALSGVSAEASTAGLTQFTQALGSGRLAGDELRSILENTPALADALAEGLGKSRGELRQLGAEGKLTTQVIIEALEKVAQRVDDDFSKLPLSVGQALTILQNNITEIVGGGSQASGAMGALARAILSVSDGIKALSQSGGKEFLTFISEAVDGFSRFVRIVGKSYGVLAASVGAIFTGGKVSEVFKAFKEDVQSVLEEPLQRDKIAAPIVASAKDLAAKRLDIERQLQDKLKELAKLRGIAEGKVSQDILDDDTKRTASQIKNAEELKKALVDAWQTSIKEAAKAGDDAQKLLDKAADIRQTGADKAAAKARSALPPEEQQAQIQSEFSKAASSAEESAALAKIAAFNNRVENAAKLTAQAEKDAERAAKLADQIDDPQAAAQAIQKAAEIQAQLAEAQAAAKKNEQQDLEARAQAQQAEIARLDAQLTELQNKAASLRVQADVTQAESQIAGLQAQLDNLKDKTVTVTVNQVGAVPASDGSAAPAAAPGSFARGGYTGPGGKWQPAGIVHAGEFVLRREVVGQRGAIEFLSRFNRLGVSALQGYANGGLVRNIRIPSISAAPPAPASNATFNFPGMGSFPAHLAPDVLGELKTAFAREALKRGRRV